MPDQVKPEHTPKTLEQTINEAIETLRDFTHRLSVAAEICEIEVTSAEHGTAVQDAIKGMMSYSNDSINNCIGGLEDVLEANREAVTA
jgi:hypothetical protein